jgi:hypothetical protein
MKEQFVSTHNVVTKHVWQVTLQSILQRPAHNISQKQQQQQQQQQQS